VKLLFVRTESFCHQSSRQGVTQDDVLDSDRAMTVYRVQELTGYRLPLPIQRSVALAVMQRKYLTVWLNPFT
jgi:hypothetical protein